ncbi:hypothetical protein HDU99_007823 [Rhizoclosmatium hyalinum]|nr:hypothetical protein HDU99_007823 [Rhizoclosmatium hyalinum]
MPFVIVIGSGLVGAVTGLALHQAGIQCSLYDQVNPVDGTSEDKAVDFGASGGAVAIQAGGLRVLRTLGLLDECLAAGIALPYCTWAKIDGSSPVVADARIWNKTAGETDAKLLAPLHILRSSLHRVLMKACHKAGIKIIVDKKLADVMQDDSSVTAYFADGTTVTADLLIGADGIHSLTRRKVFGESIKANFTGEMGHIGVVNIKEHGITFKEAEELAFYIDRDRKLFVANFKVSEDIAAVRVSTFDDPEDEDQSYRPVSDLPKHAGRLADLLHTGTAAANQARSMRAKGMAASIFGGSLNHFVFRLVVSAANASLFTLYTVFDCEEEVTKAIEEESK